MSRKAEVSIVVLAKNKAKQVLTGLRGNLTKVKNAVFSLHGAMLALGGAAIVRIGSSLVKAFGVQEKAVIKLNAALRATGRYTEEASRQIQQQASELQKLTIHGDEATIAATASMLMLADQIPVSQLEDAQKAIIGIADTFMGGDLNNAALIIGKTLSSTTNALTRYGIEIDTTGTQQEKLAEIIEQSLAFFEVSKESTQSLTDQMTQLSNALGDSKELFGQVLATVLGLDKGTGGLTEKVSGFNERLSENMTKVVAWGRVVGTVFKAILTTLAKVITGAFELGKMIGYSLETVFRRTHASIAWLANQAISVINTAIRGLNKLPKVNIAEIAEFDVAAISAGADAANAMVLESGANMLSMLQDVGDAWLGVVDAAALASAEQGKALEIGAGAGTGPGAVIPPKLPLPPPPERPTLPVEVTDDMGIEDWVPDDVSKPMWDFVDALNEALGGGRELSQVMADLTSRVIVGFGDAATDAFQAMFEGSQKAGEAFKSAMLGALGSVARGFGEFFIAKATAEIAAAIAFPPGAAPHIAAAAKYGFASAAMFTLAGGAAAAAAGGGGGGSAGVGGAMAESSAVEGKGRGQAILIIEGGLLDMGDPRQQDSLARALSTLSGLDVTVRGSG